MDPRLRAAIDASVGWYEDIMALHGVASALERGLWSALTAPPPLHSDAVVVEPSVGVDEVLARLQDRDHASFKDSYATLDPSPSAMEMLFAATWIYREAESGPDAAAPTGWSVVTDVDRLAAWTGRHDTAEVLLPGILDRAHLKVLARLTDGEIRAGAVARLGSGTVDVSNVFAVPGEMVDWEELSRAIHALFPARPLVGYERGDDLAAATAAGFVAVGELRVWVR